MLIFLGACSINKVSQHCEVSFLSLEDKFFFFFFAALVVILGVKGLYWDGNAARTKEAFSLSQSLRNLLRILDLFLFIHLCLFPLSVFEMLFWFS